MLNNQNYSITVEDLEKAASVRLFEKAAAAEGINLNELSESQVDDLYSNYQHSSEENTMNDQIIDLFEKQAAYEGVDLDSLTDEELAYVYNNFITNLAEEEKTASAEEVSEFLLEKTASVYEIMKEAADAAADAADAAGDAADAADAGAKAAPKADAPDAKDGKKMMDKAKDLFAKGKDAGGKAMAHVGAHKGKYGLGAGLTTLGGGTYLYKRNKKKKEMEKQASIDGLVEAFDSYLQDHHGVSAEDLDQDTFNNSYNEFLDLVANDVITDYQEEQDAYEKLAEAEILGRHMARAYMDEFDKEAAKQSVAARIKSSYSGRVAKARKSAKKGGQSKKLFGYNIPGTRKATRMSTTKAFAREFAPELAAGGTLAAGGGYAATRGRKGQEKKASAAIEELAFERANEFIEFGKEAGFDGSLIDDFAVEILEDNGYDVSPLFE